MELLFLVVGLSMFLVSGFSLEVNPLLLYGGLTAICLVFTVFYYDTWLTGARGIGHIIYGNKPMLAIIVHQQAVVNGKYTKKYRMYGK